MTTTTTPARIAPLAVACPRCGAGQREQCISRTGRRFTASESHTARVDAARLAAGPPPAPAEARWATLREEIKQERKAQDEIAAEHAEWGREGQSVFCYGRVKALDWVLAAMDRLEAGQ